MQISECASRSLYLYVSCLVLLTYELRLYELHVTALQCVEYLAYSNVTDVDISHKHGTSVCSFTHRHTYTTRILIARAFCVTKGQKALNRKFSTGHRYFHLSLPREN
jgi:hypothetical protein